MKACSEFSPKGVFKIEHRDKDGKLKGIYELQNQVVDVGKDHILDVGFHGVAATATWYIGLVDNAAWTAFAAADTMVSHAGWAEAVGYSEGTRVAWVEDAAAGQSITNSTSSDFNITGTATLKGVFLTSDNAKSGTAGTLWATAAFASTIPVVNTDLLKITYTINAT